MLPVAQSVERLAVDQGQSRVQFPSGNPVSFGSRSSKVGDNLFVMTGDAQFPWGFTSK